MADKQITINGVDVSVCNNYKCDGTCEISAYYLFNYDTKYKPCKNLNCYFKQLKRKEQECEELKNIINEAKNSGLDLKSFLLGEAMQEEYEEKIEKLKVKNKKLKQSLEFAEGWKDMIVRERDELKAELEIERNWHKTADEISKANSEYTAKLKQTLTEIKEIAETQQVWNEWNRQLSETESEDDIFAYNWSALEQILQKISEYKVDLE